MPRLILKASNVIKIQLLLFGLVSSIALPAFGQNHLEPEKDRAKYSGTLKEYYDEVFKRLFERMSEKPLARYVVLPSFSSEYVWSLEEASEDKYLLKRGYFSENFWYAKRRSKIKVKYAEISIDKELALLIRQLFEKAISQVAVPNEKIMGNDGVTYLFSIYAERSGLKTGEIWSPRKNTKMHAFVDLCEKYKSLDAKKEERDRLVHLTKNMIQNLK